MADTQLDLGITSKEYTSLDLILREARVSWINVLLNLIVFDVESLDRRLTLKFCLQGTCSILKEVKLDDRLCTFCK